MVECGEFHECCGVQVLVLGCIDGLWLVEVGLFITDKCDLVSVSESEHDIGWVIGFGAWSWCGEWCGCGECLDHLLEGSSTDLWVASYVSHFS